jgi:hypothetical protein
MSQLHRFQAGRRVGTRHQDTPHPGLLRALDEKGSLRPQLIGVDVAMCVDKKQKTASLPNRRQKKGVYSVIFWSQIMYKRGISKKKLPIIQKREHHIKREILKKTLFHYPLFAERKSRFYLFQNLLLFRILFHSLGIIRK